MDRVASGCIYSLIKIVLFVLYKVLFRFEWYGSEKVPDPSDERGVILAPNHASYLDPPLMGIALKRRVTYLAKEYLFRAFFVGGILRSIGALPIRARSDDFRSIREIVRILKESRCVVIFPEGTRSVDGLLGTPERGIGLIAVKSRSAVVPVFIQGTYEAFPRGARFFKCRPIRVYFGDPFVPAENAHFAAGGAGYEAVAQKIMDDIKEMKDRFREPKIEEEK